MSIKDKLEKVGKKSKNNRVDKKITSDKSGEAKSSPVAVARDNSIKEDNENYLVKVIGQAIKVPLIRVNREDFLRDAFQKHEEKELANIIEYGPVEAGISRSELKKIAIKLINKRTSESSINSFIAGLPGGFAMVATIPTDIVQYYAFALKLAQELAYLYGQENLLNADQEISEDVMNTFILYLGTMFGVTGANTLLRTISAGLSKTVMKKISQKALTKTFYYPIIKKIAKLLSVRMTKQIFAKSVSKVIPVIGGFVSGGLTFFSFKPMGMKLSKTLAESKFDYAEDEYEADVIEIKEIVEAKILEAETVEIEKQIEEASKIESVKSKNSEVLEKAEIFKSTEGSKEGETSPDAVLQNEEALIVVDTVNETLDTIKRAKNLLDQGILTNKEFSEIKSKLLENL